METRNNLRQSAGYVVFHRYKYAITWFYRWYQLTVQLRVYLKQTSYQVAGDEERRDGHVTAVRVVDDVHEHKLAGHHHHEQHACRPRCHAYRRQTATHVTFTVIEFEQYFVKDTTAFINFIIMI